MGVICMKVEQKELHATVREGYQILLRAEAMCQLPIEMPKIRSFYELMVDTCMRWALEVYGERLRREFLSLESVHEKSQFRTQRYRMTVHIPWEADGLSVFLCESYLTGRWRTPQKAYRRIAHVWCMEEELILPFSEILQRFGVKLKREMLPFRPDGIYPSGEELIFFQNATDVHPFAEHRLPICREKEENQ